MEPWVNANKRMKRALQGRHSCIAQGAMRAKPDMEPWVNIEQQNKELRRSGTYTSTQMLQRINTIQRNNHTQYSRGSAAPKGAQ